MLRKQKLFWHLLKTFSAFAVGVGFILASYFFFLHKESQNSILEHLAAKKAAFATQAIAGKSGSEVDQILKSPFWSPGQLAIWSEEGVLQAGNPLDAQEYLIYRQRQDMGGNWIIWKDDGMLWTTQILDKDQRKVRLRIWMPIQNSAWTWTITWGILGFLTLTLTAIWIAYRLSSQLTKPLEKLRHHAECFAAGDLGDRVQSSKWVEFDSLAHSLNEMASELDQRMRALERRRFEQQAILASLTEGVVALDRRGRLLEANASARHLLRLDEHANTIGQHLESLVRNTKLHELIRRTMSRDEPEIASLELVQEVGVRETEVRITPLSEGTQRIGLLLVFTDQTRLHHLEKVRRDFVANVSHELRTPITSIQGFVETLVGGHVEEPAQVQHFLGIVHRQTLRLSSILDDLLELSRLEQQMRLGEVERAPIHLKDLLESAVQACEHLAAERKSAIEVHIDENIQIEINGSLVEQALVNLISNAIKYSEDGKTVCVSSHVRSTELIISVKDQGFGIPTKHLPRIFERFYRVDKARSRSLGGTGLGLSIVRNIAVAHGGDVQVSSTLGIGSTFSLILPR